MEHFKAIKLDVTPVKIKLASPFVISHQLYCKQHTEAYKPNYIIYLIESHRISSNPAKSHNISSNLTKCTKFHHGSESHWILQKLVSHQVSPYLTECPKISSNLTKTKCQSRTSMWDNITGNSEKNPNPAILFSCRVLSRCAECSRHMNPLVHSLL